MVIMFSLIIAIGAVVAVQQLRISRLEDDVAAAKKAALETVMATSLELQKKCADQAHKVFLQLGYKDNSLAIFENHYSRRDGRCFIHVHNTVGGGGEVSVFGSLFDAFEGKVYGTYIWRTKPGKKYYEVAPIQCDVMLPTGVKKCSSEDEFSELIKFYMEDAQGSG